MVALGQWFTHSFLLALRFLSGYEHRGTLPQLRCAQQLPQRGSRGAFTIHRGACETVWLAGDFHRPYEGSEIFTFHHSSENTPSGREPGMGGCHSFCHPDDEIFLNFSCGAAKVGAVVV